MIWFKCWTDARTQAMFGLAIVVMIALFQAVLVPSGLTILGMDPARFQHLPIVTPNSLPDPHAPGFTSSLWWVIYLNVAVPVAALIAILTAGSGISTHVGDRAGRTIHPSAIYTLSLPAKRSRWMAVRAAMSGLILAFLVFLLVVIPAALAPFTGGKFSWTSALACFPFMIVGAGVFQAFCMFLATFLEETYHVLFCVVTLIGLVLVVSSGRLPPLNIFRLMSGLNPSMLGAGVCLALIALFFSGAIWIADRREF